MLSKIQRLNIKWESEPDMIDVSGDITDIPPDNKD